MECYKMVLETISALGVPILAAVGLVFARQQAQTNRNRLKLEQFDKRWAIYDGTVNFISAILREGALKFEDSRAFLTDTAGARFIFDDAIDAYLEQIRKDAMNLHLHGVTKEHEKEGEMLQLLHTKLGELEDVFLPYMRIED